MNINYDFELILTCKRYNLSDTQLIDKLREVWAARCDINIDEVRNIHIAEYLIQIAEAIYNKYQPYNLRITSIVSELSPVNDFKYKGAGENYWNRVLLIY